MAKIKIKDDNSAQNIINIIGEPIIKRELQRMLKIKWSCQTKQKLIQLKRNKAFD